MPTQKQKLETLKQAAASGSIDAIAELGFCYYSGVVTQKDADKAAELFKQAADAGSIDAQVGIGLCRMKGLGGFEKDSKLGAEAVQKAADAGCSTGFYWLAVQKLARKTPENIKKGMSLLESAARSHSGLTKFKADSAVRLGVRYQTGEGVPKDSSKAVEWYTIGADLGNATAQALLASSLRHGTGIAADKEHAWQLEIAAAENGNKDSAMWLGNQYEWGIETAADFSKAVRMYDLAYENGEVVALFNRLIVTAGSGITDVDPAPGPIDYDKLSQLQKLTAREARIVGIAADLVSDTPHALEYFKKCAEQADFNKISPPSRRDVKRAVYYRTRGIDDYFEVLATASSLRRFECAELIVFIPVDTHAYSAEAKQIILKSLDQWMSAIDYRFSIRETSDETEATMRFLPVKKEIFFGNSLARTCYLEGHSKRLLAVRDRVLIQLPRYDLRSADDRSNFNSLCLHEIGHALGLSVHSSSAKDIMFTVVPHQSSLSDGDVHAIRSLHADDAEAKISELLGRETERENPYALCRTGQFLLSLDLKKQAMVKLERASELNNEQAHFILGMQYWRSLNFRKARILLGKADAGGISEAKMYRNWLFGLKSESDKEKIEALHTAAAHGNTPSLVALGLGYTFGDKNLPRDIEKGAAMLKQAADQGHPLAAIGLAINSMAAASDKLFHKKK
ncbi:MAG TPA: matrixin family metalloprotease [Trichormus sp.]|jgi:TPR repeat protein